MKRVWLAWLVFGICAAAMLAIMGWGSRKLIESDAAEKRAKQEAALEENVRLSLWRMETALASIIAQENSRPYATYVSSSKRSPDSPYVKLHFQVDARRKSVIPRGTAFHDPATLGALTAAIPRTWIHVEQSEAGGVVRQPEQLQQRATLQVPAPQSQMARNVQDFEARAALNSALVQGQSIAVVPPLRRLPDRSSVEIRTGVLAPIWVGEELILARHVQAGTQELIQGCSLDWGKVRSKLLSSFEDLLPGSDLIPERGPFDPAEGRTLTSLPLRLVPGRVPGAPAGERSPLVFSLVIAWACVLVAIVAVGMLLMGAISLSQRRAAFVSSVTHELRSPLTTFRMYTEMLVEGMAADPVKQSEYHQILYRESDRLMHLVENVLAYARLEKGRYGDKESVPIANLIDRIRERLTEHARRANMELVVAIDDTAAEKIVTADTAAIERILFNLVDNACKYARAATDRRIHLEVCSDGNWCRIAVRDHGPGIDPVRAKSLFRPFTKTVNEAAKSAPGVGIGLALSRRLAKAAGGRLVVEDSIEGACVRLDLPAV